MTGVTRIELVAEVNGVWRAKVECMAKPPADLMAEAVTTDPSPWQRIKRRCRILFGPPHRFPI